VHYSENRIGACIVWKATGVVDKITKVLVRKKITKVSALLYGGRMTRGGEKLTGDGGTDELTFLCNRWFSVRTFKTLIPGAPLPLLLY
jgi:hypothetical protein